MSEYRSALFQLASQLRTRGALPKHMEVSRLGPVFLASSFDEVPTATISESVASGMDFDATTAALKSLVERAERRAFVQGKSVGHPLCMTNRSDGFAAMPVGLATDSAARARENALNEAVERFVWARWWDDPLIGHVLADLAQSDEKRVLVHLKEQVSIRQIYRIEPLIADRGRHVVIYFAFLKPFGVISGGACESADRSSHAEFRALCELARHGLALQRMLNTGASPSSFYEKRLRYFGATQEGEKCAMGRLLAGGTETIELPRIELDGPVPHDLDDLISVHRCYFEDQPPFVGGKLERLCL